MSRPMRNGRWNEREKKRWRWWWRRGNQTKSRRKEKWNLNGMSDSVNANRFCYFAWAFHVHHQTLADTRNQVWLWVEYYVFLAEYRYGPECVDSNPLTGRVSWTDSMMEKTKKTNEFAIDHNSSAISVSSSSLSSTISQRQWRWQQPVHHAFL